MYAFQIKFNKTKEFQYSAIFKEVFVSHDYFVELISSRCIFELIQSGVRRKELTNSIVAGNVIA